MSSVLTRLFLDHPASVDESYLGHMRFALWFSGRLALAAGAALVHAVVPFCCQKTAGKIVIDLAERMQQRGH